MLGLLPRTSMRVIHWSIALVAAVLTAGCAGEQIIAPSSEIGTDHDCSTCQSRWLSDYEWSRINAAIDEISQECPTMGETLSQWANETVTDEYGFPESRFGAYGTSSTNFATETH